MKSSSIVISSALHISLVVLTALSLPFLSKKPIDLTPIVSVELIQITDQTNIPFAPKAEKIIEKVKKEKEKLVSEQAPPKKVKKEKPDVIPLPDQEIEKFATIFKRQFDHDLRSPHKRPVRRWTPGFAQQRETQHPAYPRR